MTYETRGVLADAYEGGARRRARESGRMLSHTIEIDDAGQHTRVLCKSVSLESMSDVGAVNEQGELDTAIRATCPTCACRDPRFQGNGVGAKPAGRDQP